MSGQKWTEDDFGIVTWRARVEGDVCHANGHEPFTKMLSVLNAAPKTEGIAALIDAAIHVHNDLEVARSIAVSLFGKLWRDHVMNVYDRMQLEIRRRGQ